MTRNKQAANLPLPPEEILSDYRILDGASADGFLVKVKETLEKWA
jgi:pyruvate/2-oxoglutarate dehydrogenase complex dihydrolipoamide acyltransferase (E2) component